MKLNVAVTGHTSGLGKEIYKFYADADATTVGFSRSNGFDLRDWSNMQRMLDLTESFDLIFSNAKPDFFQTVFLYEFAKRKNFNTKIVSIGSQIVNSSLVKTVDIGINLYKTQKLALQNAHQQLTLKIPELKSVLIHPAHLYDNNDNDSKIYSNIRNWVKNMNTVVVNNHSVELYVD
jgi:hypothetical protein